MDVLRIFSYLFFLYINILKTNNLIILYAIFYKEDPYFKISVFQKRVFFFFFTNYKNKSTN